MTDSVFFDVVVFLAFPFLARPFSKSLAVSLSVFHALIASANPAFCSRLCPTPSKLFWGDHGVISFLLVASPSKKD